jgi:serine/threonine protein kinase
MKKFKGGGQSRQTAAEAEKDVSSTVVTSARATSPTTVGQCIANVRKNSQETLLRVKTGVISVASTGVHVLTELEKGVVDVGTAGIRGVVGAGAAVAGAGIHKLHELEKGVVDVGTAGIHKLHKLEKGAFGAGSVAKTMVASSAESTMKSIAALIPEPAMKILAALDPAAAVKKLAEFAPLGLLENLKDLAPAKVMQLLQKQHSEKMLLEHVPNHLAAATPPLVPKAVPAKADASIVERKKKSILKAKPLPMPEDDNEFQAEVDRIAETTANVPERKELVAISPDMLKGIETFEEACDLMWDNFDFQGAVPGFEHVCGMPNLDFKQPGVLRGSFSRLKASSNTLWAYCLYGIGKEHLRELKFEDAAAKFEAMTQLLARGRRVERATFFRGFALCEAVKIQALQDIVGASQTIAEIFHVEDCCTPAVNLREYVNTACAKYVKALQSNKTRKTCDGEGSSGNSAYVLGRVAMFDGGLKEAEEHFRHAMVYGIGDVGVGVSADRRGRANLLRKKCSENRNGKSGGSKMTLKGLHARTKGIGTLISSFGGGMHGGSPANAARKLSRDKGVADQKKKVLDTVTFESPSTVAQKIFTSQLAKMHENTGRLTGFAKKRQQQLMIVVRHALPWDMLKRAPIQQFLREFSADLRWALGIEIGVLEVQHFLSHPERSDWVIVSFAFNKPAIDARKLQDRYWSLFDNKQSSMYSAHLRTLRIEREATLAIYSTIHGSVQKAKSLCCAADYRDGERVMMWQNKAHAFWCTIVHQLGGAEFSGSDCAKIYSVRYAGMPKGEKCGTKCALKSYRATNNIDALCREILLRIQLTSIASHPNVLSMYFACYREATDECFLLTRWVGGNPLHDLMADECIYKLDQAPRGGAPDTTGSNTAAAKEEGGGDEDEEQYTTDASTQVQVQARLVKLWFEVATALEHCHHQGVVHQDVRPKNILCFVDGDNSGSAYNYSAVLTNFELSSIDKTHTAWRGHSKKGRKEGQSDHDHETTTDCNGGNRIFASPHVHAVLDKLPDAGNHNATESDDIWSFAASLLDSFAECGWRKDLTVADALADDCSTKLRKMKFEVGLPAGLKELLVDCFSLPKAQAKAPRVSASARMLFSVSRDDQANECARLTMGTVADRLSVIYKSLTYAPLQRPQTQPPIEAWLKCFIHNNLGLALHSAGYVEHACVHYERALVASQTIRAAEDAAVAQAAAAEAAAKPKAAQRHKHKKQETAASAIQARVRGRNARRKAAREKEAGLKAMAGRDDGDGHAAALNNLAVAKLQLSRGGGDFDHGEVGVNFIPRLFESAYHSYERAIAHTLRAADAQCKDSTPLTSEQQDALNDRARQAQRQLAQRKFALDVRGLDRSALEGAFEFIEEIPIDAAVKYMPGQQLEFATKNPSQPTRLTVKEILTRSRKGGRRTSVFSKTDVLPSTEGVEDEKELQYLVSLVDEEDESDDDLEMGLDEDDDDDDDDGEKQAEASTKVVQGRNEAEGEKEDPQAGLALMSKKGMALALGGFLTATENKTFAHAKRVKKKRSRPPRLCRRLRRLVLGDCHPAVHEAHSYADGQDGGHTCRCRYMGEDADPKLQKNNHGGGPPVWLEGTIRSFKLSFDIEGRGLQYYMRWQRLMEEEYGRVLLQERDVLEKLKKEIMEATMLLDCPPLTQLEINWGKVDKELQPEGHECSKWDNVTTYYPEALDEVLHDEYQPCNDEVTMVYPPDFNSTAKSTAANKQMGKMNQAVESMKLIIHPPDDSHGRAGFVGANDGAMQIKICTQVPAGPLLQAMRLLNMTCFEHRQLVERNEALRRQDQEEVRQVEEHAQAQYWMRLELRRTSAPVCDVEDERILAAQNEKITQLRLETVLTLAKLEAQEAQEEEQDKLARKRLLVLEEDFQLDDELFSNLAQLSLLLTQEAEAQKSLAKAHEKKEQHQREEAEKASKKKKKGGAVMPSKYEVEEHRLRAKLAEFAEKIDEIQVAHPELKEKTELEKVLHDPERQYKTEERSEGMEVTREAIEHCDTRLTKAKELGRKYAKLRTLMWLIEGTRRESDRLLQILHPGKKKKVKQEKGSRQTRSQIFAEQKQLEADEWHYGRMIDDVMVTMVEDIVMLLSWSTAEDEKKFSALLERKQAKLQADIDGEHFEVVKEEVDTPAVQQLREDLTRAYKSVSFYAWRRVWKVQKQKIKKKQKGGRRYSNQGMVNLHKEQEMRVRFMVTALKVEPALQRHEGFVTLDGLEGGSDAGSKDDTSEPEIQVQAALALAPETTEVIEAVKGPYSLTPVIQYATGQLLRVFLHAEWEWAQVIASPNEGDGSRHRLRVVGSGAVLVCDLNEYNHSYALFHREQLQLQMWRYRLFMCEKYGKTYDVLCGAARPWDVQTETAHRLLAKKSPMKGKWPRLFTQSTVLNMLCGEVGSRLRGSYRPQSVLVTGPSSSGKTTLLQNWACAVCHTHTHIVPIFISVKQLCKILRQRRLAAGAAAVAAARAEQAKEALGSIIDRANDAGRRALEYIALKAKMFGASATLQAEALATSPTKRDAEEDEEDDEGKKKEEAQVEREQYDELIPGCISILTEYLQQQFLPAEWKDGAPAPVGAVEQEGQKKDRAGEALPTRRRSSTDGGSQPPQGLSSSPSQPIMATSGALLPSPTGTPLLPSNSNKTSMTPSHSTPVVNTRKRSHTSGTLRIPGGSDLASIVATNKSKSPTKSPSKSGSKSKSESISKNAGGDIGLYLLLKQALMEKRVLFLVDGVDEAGPKLQSTVQAFIDNELISAGHRVVVTSRDDCTRAADFTNCTKLRLLPLFESQQAELLKRRVPDPVVREKTRELLQLPPYDTVTTNPMMLSILTSIASGIQPMCTPLPKGSEEVEKVKVTLERSSLVFRAAFIAMIRQGVSKDADHQEEEEEDKRLAAAAAASGTVTDATAEVVTVVVDDPHLLKAKSPTSKIPTVKGKAKGKLGAAKAALLKAEADEAAKAAAAVPKIRIPKKTAEEEQEEHVQEILCSLQDVAFDSQQRKAGYDKHGAFNESGQYRTFSAVEAATWDTTSSWKRTTDMIERGLLPMVQKLPPSSFTSIATSPKNKQATTASRLKRAKTLALMKKVEKKKDGDEEKEDDAFFGGATEGAEAGSVGGRQGHMHMEFQFMQSSFQEYMVAERLVMEFDKLMRVMPPLRARLERAEEEERVALEKAQAGAGHKTRLKAVSKVRKRFHKVKTAMVMDIDEAIESVRVSLNKYLLESEVPMEPGQGVVNIAISDRRWKRVLLFVADILEARGDQESGKADDDSAEKLSFDHACLTPRKNGGRFGEDFTDFSNVLMAKRVVFTQKLDLLSVQALAGYLRCNQSMEELHLNAAKLDADLARRTCSALRQNQELAGLFLHIGPAGSESAVLAELCHCSYLTHLDVSDAGAAECRRAAEAKDALKQRTTNGQASPTSGGSGVRPNPLLPPTEPAALEEDEPVEEMTPLVKRQPQYFPDAMFDLMVTLDSYCFDGNDFENIEPGSVGYMLIFEYQNLKDQLVIDVGGRELQGIFPEALYRRLFALDYFDFRLCAFKNVKKNTIRGMFIYEFRNLREQTEIDLKFLGLEGPVEDISRLPNLQHLWLHGNQLTGSLPLSVLEMKARCGKNDADAPMSPSKLMTKHQHQQQLPQSAPTAQHQNTALHTSSCFFNSNVGFALPGVSVLSRISRDIIDLCLVDCSLTGNLTDLAAAGLTRLKRLELEDNHFTGEFPEGVYKMLFNQLDYFNFRGSKFDIPAKTLKGVVVHEMTTIMHLATLDLKHRHLRGPFPQELLVMLFKLEYFNFEGNDFEVDDETRQYLRSFHRVKYSHIESLPACALDGADEKQLERSRCMGALSPQHRNEQGGGDLEISATGFNIGDKVQVTKNGSCLGMMATVTVPSWVGRVKVEMARGGGVKSYLPEEIMLLQRSTDGRESPKKKSTLSDPLARSLPQIDSPMMKPPMTPSKTPSQKAHRTPALKPPLTPDRRPSNGGSARPRSRSRGRSGGGDGGAGGSGASGLLPRM